MPSLMYVRLKPYDPLRSQVLIDWTAPWGTKYRQNDWHEIDADDPENAAALRFLASIHEHVVDPHSPLAFDICTLTEAQDLIASEKATKVDQLIPDELRGPRPPKAIKSKRSVALNRVAVTHELELASPQPEAPPREAPPASVESRPVEPEWSPKPKKRASKRRVTRKRSG